MIRSSNRLRTGSLEWTIDRFHRELYLARRPRGKRGVEIRSSIVSSYLLVAIAIASATAGSGPLGSATVTQYPNAGEDYDLADATILELHGERTGQGCEFSFPELQLEFGEQAIEARLLETDSDSCKQLIEIGTPPPGHEQVPEDGTSETQDFEDRNPEASADIYGSGVMAASGSDSAYYEVRWKDVFNVTVNYTRANVSWSWNGSCVTSSSGWGTYWWRTGTGWSKVTGYGYVSTTCSNAYSVVDWAHYMNNTFCAPAGVEVDTFVNDAWVRGYFDGAITGGKNSTWEVETPGNPNNCPDLHYTLKLVRT